MRQLLAFRRGLVLASAIVGVGATVTGAHSPTEIKAAVALQTDLAEPTIEALQTRVAVLEATVAAGEPTPSSTPIPRPSPNADPMPLTPDTELLYYYLVPNSQGEVSLFGEVRNITEMEIPSPYVRFTVLDIEGNIVDTIDARPLFSFVGSGESVPVEASFTGVSVEDWATEEFMGCGEVSANLIPEGLSIEDVQETRKDARGLELAGRVRNNGEVPAERVSVRASLFRPDGRFGGFGTALIQSPIPPGKTARFTLSVYGSDMAGIADAGGTYTYTVEPSVNSVAVYFC